MTTPTTPEAHHGALMAEIDYELDTYGAASLADLIASMIDARCDTDDNTPTATYYRAARRIFEDASEQIARLTRPFDLITHEETQA